MSRGEGFRRLSAGIVIVRLTDGVPHFLLLRAYRYWDFPKGEVEHDETPLDTAIREVEEETRLTDLRFGWGHGYTETEPYGRGKVARYYLAEAPTGEVELPVNPDLGRPEHHEYRWVAVQEARSLVNDRLNKILDWAVRRIAGN